MAEVLSEDTPTLVGIDHGFSFPLRYFTEHGVALDWRVFLEDFRRHWPTDDDHTYVDFVREGVCGDATARSGNARWRRVTEIRARGAKSVFHFDVQGSVAKSTHSGIPWLQYVDLKTAGRVHFWPFDGWDLSAGKSVVTEVYPALWSRSFPKENRDGHQHDAYSIAAWMREADSIGSLSKFASPPLDEADRRAAEIEGWILGRHVTAFNPCSGQCGACLASVEPRLPQQEGKSEGHAAMQLKKDWHITPKGLL